MDCFLEHFRPEFVVISSLFELSLKKPGMKYQELVYWNPPSPSLYEEAARHPQGHLSQEGPLIVQGG